MFKSATMATTGKTLNWDNHKIRESHRTVRAIDHTLRRRMLDIIYDAIRINVTDLYITLRLEQSVCSQHLGILRRAGFVEMEREGKFLYYSIAPSRIEVVKEAIAKLSDK